MGLRFHRRAQAIARTPTTQCAYVAPGPVELVGRAQATGGRAITTRLTGQPAAMARYELQQRHKNSWRTLHGWSEPADFVLDDGTGRVLVAPGERDVDVGHDRSPVSKLREDMDAQLQRRVREHLHGKFPTGFWGSGYRVIEKAIAVGAPVYALGEAQAHTLRDEPKVRFLLAHGPQQELLLSLTGEAQQLRKARRTAYGLWAMTALMLVATAVLALNL